MICWGFDSHHVKGFDGLSWKEIPMCSWMGAPRVPLSNKGGVSAGKEGLNDVWKQTSHPSTRSP